MATEGLLATGGRRPGGRRTRQSWIRMEGGSRARPKQRKKRRTTVGKGSSPGTLITGNMQEWMAALYRGSGQKRLVTHWYTNRAIETSWRAASMREMHKGTARGIWSSSVEETTEMRQIVIAMTPSTNVLSGEDKSSFTHERELRAIRAT
jgi:hypothetical protein